MKKTVNINLAGIFFHIDEDAYGKLQRYLAAIKKSLTEPQGSDEIMRDIEARISELFSEKVESTSQVISLKELDEVIAVMGQPEDYMVDEELFEDPENTNYSRPKTTSHKQLFRDIDNKFISGVSSGLGHYLGIDAVWVRLLWILLTFLTSGTFILIYILFWILVPAAVTTADKLKMTGEAVNISNIEKKFKEGYESVADKVKNVDYDKYGQRVKSGASGFFNTLGNILLAILKIFVKFFGIILILTSLTVLVGLIIGLFTLGSVDFWGNGEVMDYIAAFSDSAFPIWLVSLSVFFAIGIPFFVMFILGLKLLINNLKSIGTVAKIILFVIWISSLVTLAGFGIKLANDQAFEGEYITETTLPTKVNDTLFIRMVADNKYSEQVYKHGGLKFKHNDEGEKVIYSNDIRLVVKSTTDSVANLIIEKRAEGNSFINATNRAEAINYNFKLENNTLLLDGFHTSDLNNKYRDQEVQLTLYMPIGSIINAHKNTYSFHRNTSWFGDILDNGDEGKFLRILDNGTECIDCPLEREADSSNDPDTNQENYNDWEEEVLEELSDDAPSQQNNAIRTETISDSLNTNQSI